MQEVLAVLSIVACVILAGDDCETTATGWYKPSNIPPVCDGDHDVNKKDEDEEDQDQDEDEKKDEG